MPALGSLEDLAPIMIRAISTKNRHVAKQILKYKLHDVFDTQVQVTNYVQYKLTCFQLVVPSCTK